MLTTNENALLTRVGPGTPMGALLRCYWHPIAAVGELDQRVTKEVTVLGEELVLYKDRSGSLGLIGRRCAHRRVSLVYGVPEADGLRCQYHGWKFDATGQCTEAPFEDTVNPEARFRDRIKLAGYPVQELGGLVFAYLGPEPAPLLPRWGPLVWDNAVCDVGLTVLPCNWLQCQENSLDPVHSEWLHAHYGNYVREQLETDPALPPEFQHRTHGRHRKIGFDLFKYGVIKRRLVEGRSEEHEDWRRGHPVLFPNIVLVGSDVQANLQFRVPIDETHTLHISHFTWRAAPGSEAPVQRRVPFRHVPLLDGDGGFLSQTRDLNQDYMAWSTQGAIAERDQEHLGQSDTGIILFRRLLRQQLERVQDGGEPMNVFRPPAPAEVPDLPLETARPGYERPLRTLRYLPTEGGQSEAMADIEKVLSTYEPGGSAALRSWPGCPEEPNHGMP